MGRIAIHRISPAFTDPIMSAVLHVAVIGFVLSDEWDAALAIATGVVLYKVAFCLHRFLTRYEQNR